MKSKDKKESLIHYPNFFLSKLIFRVVSWLAFGFLFVVGGKKYATTDLLGKVYKTIFGKEKKFDQYFINAKEADKFKTLNFAIYVIAVIIILQIISLLINLYLWEKDKYIENNNFYLHNKWIFITDSFIHIACALLLTFSFISFFTVILSLLFVSLNTWELLLQKKKLKRPQINNFFSWKNHYACKILLYSMLVIFVVPLVIGGFQHFHNEAMTGSPEGFSKTYQEMINSSETIKKIVELITNANYDLFHWFILGLFVKNIISERKGGYENFWTEINNIEKKVNNFKHYYHYQEKRAITNNLHINLGDYNYLKNSPTFLSKNYLRGDLNVENFSRQNKDVVKYIEFCEQKVEDSAKKNFLNYCLFNEFGSWEDCLRTKNLIKTARK